MLPNITALGKSLGFRSLLYDQSISGITDYYQKHVCYVNLSKEVENAKQQNVDFMQHGGLYLHGIITHAVTYKKSVQFSGGFHLL